MGRVCVREEFFFIFGIKIKKLELSLRLLLPPEQILFQQGSRINPLQNFKCRLRFEVLSSTLLKYKMKKLKKTENLHRIKY